jgi:hypothetical protein
MTDVQRISEALLARVQELIPLADDRILQAQAASLGTEEVVDRLGIEARNLRNQHGLGIVGSARVLLELQRRLFAAGYAPDLVRKLVFSMTLQLFTGRK